MSPFQTLCEAPSFLLSSVAVFPPYPAESLGPSRYFHALPLRYGPHGWKQTETLMYPSFVKILPMWCFAKHHIGEAYTVKHLW